MKYYYVPRAFWTSQGGHKHDVGCERLQLQGWAGRENDVRNEEKKTEERINGRNETKQLQLTTML